MTPRRIEPLARVPHVTVRVPGSKSFTNRALICAALARGTSELRGALGSDDTDAMVDCLARLGIGCDRDGDTWTVQGTAGAVPPGPRHLDVRLSGTTARFVAPLVALGSGEYRIDGEATMRRRPMAPTFEALRVVGAAVEDSGGHLPCTVRGGARGGNVEVAGDASSQFLSGLLLSAPCLPEGLRVAVAGELVSRPYVEMTLATMRAFGGDVEGEYVVRPGCYEAATYAIEPDASAASYFFAAAAITGGTITVEGLGTDALQGDVAFVDVLERMGAVVDRRATSTTVTGGPLRGVEADFRDISDTAQTIAAVAVFADGPTRVTGIGFIRRKETDRIRAVVTELGRCGIRADEEDDGFVVYPGAPTPAVVQTYDDHRMAMSFSLLGLRAPGIEIADPDCVAKTFPDFFERLDGLR